MRNSKKVLITVGIISVILIVTFGLSVAFFSYVKEGTKENAINTGELTFIYKENSNGINLTDAFPISDSEGKVLEDSSQYFDFTVESKLANNDLNYEVVVDTSGSTLPLDIIKFYLTEVEEENGEEIETPITNTIYTNGTVKTLNEYSDTLVNNIIGKTVYQETILKSTRNYTKKFRARIWLKDGIDWTDQDYIGKTGVFKVNVYAGSYTKMEDVYLSSLSVTDYQLSPEFSKGNNEYTLVLEDDSIEINATGEVGATITGTGTKTLDWGFNTKVISVSKDNNLRNYKININNQRPTPPTITGGTGDSYVLEPATISVSTEGTALSGVDHYEYIWKTENVTPSDSDSADGVTDNSYEVSRIGTTYVWFRTVSEGGFKSAWSNPQVINLKTSYLVTFDYNYNLFNQTATTLTNFNDSTNYTLQFGSMPLDNIELNDIITFEADISYKNLTANEDQGYFFVIQAYGDVTYWSSASYSVSDGHYLGTGTDKVTWVWTVNNSDIKKNNRYKFQLRSDHYTGGEITISNVKITKNNTAKTVVLGEEYGELPTPTRNGYTFKGWNGKNLIDMGVWLDSFTSASNGEILKNKDEGSIKVTATSYDSYTDSWDINNLNRYKISVEPNKAYTISWQSNNQKTGFVYTFVNSKKTSGYIFNGNNKSKNNFKFTTPEDAEYITFRVGTVYEGDSITYYNIQLEEGTVATEYEPYYITNTTKVVQDKNHTLKAIWEKDNN